MSPSRPSSLRRNPSASTKPYSRGVLPTVYSSDPLDMKPSAGVNAPVPNDNPQSAPVERPGFPTYAQYKQVEAAYIQSLTPRRQGKALISQALFDRIWDVLHNPDSQGETAQFRFWARKMFTLSKTHRSTLSGLNKPNNPPQEVLLHDNLLVAIQEQLYDLLCYCHGSTGHGGRDKTCALIRKHYTWVPKDLVSSFIKACPTCIMKKCGNIDSTLATQMVEQRADDAKLAPDLFAGYGSYADNAPSVTSSTFSVAGTTKSASWQTLPSTSGDSNTDEDDPIEAAYREAVQRARTFKASLSASHSRGLQSLPMAREVSLYEGLPNGWQYRHIDYASAHAEFMKAKDSGFIQDGEPTPRVKRPRIPSILPLWSPEQFIQGEYPVQDIPPLVDASQQQNLEDENAPFQYLLLGRQQPTLFDFKDFKGDPQCFGEEIDPLLLQLPDSPPRSTSNTVSTEDKTNVTDVDSTNHNVPMSLKRAAAPPRLEFSFTTEKAFTVYRNPLREADITPDSPLMGLTWDQPVSSASDCSSRTSSRLSVFGTTPLSATTTVSSASSTLRTPVDEFPSGTNESDPMGLSMMKGSVKIEAAEIELSDGIKQACGL